ncbi:MAG: helix-turn-helix domain-containing protein [Lachnospiraceae bacterium]|nr:helix-turn-helix domain-containing protein [Lachnospiraceae bacterium]
MISNQIIQNCINDIKGISKLDFLVTDSLGNTIAQTSEEDSIEKSILLSFMQSAAEVQELKGRLLFKVNDEGQISHVLSVKGEGEAFLVGKLTVSQLENLIVAYKDRIDKNSFYQNLLLDNLLLVDIYNRAQKLHIEAVQPRCVFVIEIRPDNSPNTLEMVKELFNPQSGDFVTSVDENHIIVIKALEENGEMEELDETARMLIDMLASEAMENARVAYGTVVNEIKGISKSYKEATMALDVGKIFYAEKSIVAYSTLGIGRLIYQLPVNLCQMFITEILGEGTLDELDDEILTTVNKFFENSLNVSETSRQLYIHRNTLVYRIEKLQKATGLDVRIFEDALTLKLALMVESYIRYMNEENGPIS